MQRVIQEDFVNFENFSCLIFLAENFLILQRPKISQGGGEEGSKCPNTPNFFTSGFIFPHIPKNEFLYHFL